MNFRRAGVAQGFKGLWHYSIVGRHHKHHDVGDIGATRAHGAEGRVAGRIEESDLLEFVLSLGMRKRNCVGADMLSDASGLACSDVGLADDVEQ